MCETENIKNLKWIFKVIELKKIPGISVSKSSDLIKLAIKRMIPKGPLGRKQLSNCKIYSNSQHSHESQKPTLLDISKLNSKNTIK